MSDPRRGPDWRWWRAETIIQDGYQCQDCGVRGGREGDATLHAHHETPVAEGGDTSLENLTTLCEDCHYERHSVTTISQNSSYSQIDATGRNNSTGRALLTDGERKYLLGQADQEEDQRMYEARSRVKARIRQRAVDDVEFLAEHHPDLLDELRAVVCDGADDPREV